MSMHTIVRCGTMRLLVIVFLAVLECFAAGAVAMGGDILRVSNDGKRKSVITRGGVVPGGLSPTGSVTLLEARARVNLVPSVATKPPPAMPYSGPFPQSAGPVSVVGVKYVPSAFSQINVTAGIGGYKWDSTGSYATRTKNGATAVETYLARAIIKDPMQFDGILENDEVTFEMELGTDASILVDLETDPSESWTAEMTGYDETDLNGLGSLWSWSWSVDSGQPDTATFSFVSNPLLGLDDIAISNLFSSLATYDSVSGLHSLTSSFVVSATVSVAAGQDSFSFGGEEIALLQGASVPEPATISLMGFSFVLLLLGRVFPRSQARFA
jgi:hypothetical protein